MHPQQEPSTAVLHRPSVDGPRTAVHRCFEQLQDPSVALQILRRSLPSDPVRVQARCTPRQSWRGPEGRVNPFVVRVDTVTTTGQRESFAFKGYPDDGGERVMGAFGGLATCRACPPDTCPVSRPLAYLPQKRVLISRWAHGQSVLALLKEGAD